MHFSKCISQNGFLKMHFSKCISQNVFLKMYFSKCISQNVFLKMYERAVLFSRLAGQTEIWIPYNGVLPLAAQKETLHGVCTYYVLTFDFFTSKKTTVAQNDNLNSISIICNHGNFYQRYLM